MANENLDVLVLEEHAEIVTPTHGPASAHR
jgi:flavin-dependent dehydrogenase